MKGERKLQYRNPLDQVGDHHMPDKTEKSEESARVIEEVNANVTRDLTSFAFNAMAITAGTLTASLVENLVDRSMNATASAVAGGLVGNLFRF
jgi:hypothetical protein